MIWKWYQSFSPLIVSEVDISGIASSRITYWTANNINYDPPFLGRSLAPVCQA
jgi:hypothetical protein